MVDRVARSAAGSFSDPRRMSGRAAGGTGGRRELCIACAGAVDGARVHGPD